MEKDKLKKELKKNWIKKNFPQISFVVILVLGLFVLAVASHKFMFIIMGILLGSISIFWGRNKMMIYPVQSQDNSLNFYNMQKTL